MEWDYVPIGSVLWQACQRRGYAALARLDPISGALSVRADGEVPAVLRSFTGGPLTVDQIARLQAVIGQRETPVGLLFPYAARRFPRPGCPTRSCWSSWAGSRLSATPPARSPSDTSPRSGERSGGVLPADPLNTVFWLCERQEDLHSAFPLSSRALRVIRVPVPTLDARRTAADFAMRNLQEDGQPGRAAADAAATALAEVTHGMTVREVFACGDVAWDAACPSTGTPRRLDCCGSGSPTTPGPRTRCGRRSATPRTTSTSGCSASNGRWPRPWTCCTAPQWA